MLVFPNCKINLGLHVISKRSDGYHNIETVFYPVGWCDALEVIEAEAGAEPFQLSQSGLAIEGDSHSNLIYKTWQIIAAQKKLPPLKAHLHKHIPMGAGLGGGSADAAFFINLLNTKFHLNYSLEERLQLASQLGSDCAFFISNTPVFAAGRGNEFTNIQVDLSSYYILVVYPDTHSNTQAAYQGLTPAAPEHPVTSVIRTEPIQRWKELLTNDFEDTVFKKYPQIAALKDQLYASGALYASMSGSGSAVFGIFDQAPQVSLPHNYLHFVQKPQQGIL